MLETTANMLADRNWSQGKFIRVNIDNKRQHSARARVLPQHPIIKGNGRPTERITIQAGASSKDIRSSLLETFSFVEIFRPKLASHNSVVALIWLQADLF